MPDNWHPLKITTGGKPESDASQEWRWIIDLPYGFDAAGVPTLSTVCVLPNHGAGMIATCPECQTPGIQLCVVYVPSQEEGGEASKPFLACAGCVGEVAKARCEVWGVRRQRGAA